MRVSNALRLSLIVAGLMIGSVAFYLILTQPSVPPSQCGANGCPHGAPLAVAPPTEASEGSTQWYNFSVASSGGGLTWGDVAFQVQTSSGLDVMPFGHWAAEVVGTGGFPVASFDWGSHSWSSGETVAISNSQTIVLTIVGGQTLFHQGDSFVVLGQGAYSGLVSVVIP